VGDLSTRGRETLTSAGSLEALREFNRLRVIDALRQRGIASRAELARVTGLSRTTVATLVSDLQERGLVVERPELERDGRPAGKGRPPVLLGLDPSAGAAVGVGYDHRHIRVAVADLSSTVLGEREQELDVDHEATAALDAAAGMLDELLDSLGMERDQVVGAGMGLPGPIDRETGTVGSTVIMPGWVGLEPRRELAGRLGVHVEVDNDANLGALGEVLFGAARGLGDVVYVKVAAGIGAGLVLDGNVYRGARGEAGELGHVQARPEGAVCRCGNRGCLETIASAPALVELLRATHGPDLTVRDLLDLVAAGDRAATRVVDDAGRAIGRVLADLCDLLNPEAIVVGGDLAAAGEPFLGAIRQAIDRRALPSAAEAVDVRPGLLGERAEVLGALALVIGNTERLRSAGLAALQADGRPGGGGRAH
jgi:predicted NBD/HSP70 family sugar kinase